MPEYMEEFDDDFEFKDLPDETTPHNAKNMGRVLKNTRLLKRFINDVINGNVDLKVGNIESKNILKLFSYNKTTTRYGITSAIDENGIFTLSGTATNDILIEFIYKFDNSNASNPQQTDKIELDSSKKYAFSMQSISGICEGSLKVSLATKDNKQYDLDNTNNLKILENETGISRGFISIVSGSKLTDYKFALQLEEGETETSYTPYIDFKIYNTNNN